MKKLTFILLSAVIASFVITGCNTTTDKSADDINYARWNNMENQKMNAEQASGEFGVSPSNQNFLDPDALNPSTEDNEIGNLLKFGEKEASQ